MYLTHHSHPRKSKHLMHCRMRLKVGVVLAECCDVPMTKCQRINATERREEHRFLGLVQHERIVHETDAGLYVVWLLTPENLPKE